MDSLTAFRKNQPEWQLDLWLLASRTSKRDLSVVQATPFVILCDSSVGNEYTHY
jgi:hypothetical protein